MSRMINDLFEVSELAHHGPENLFLSLIILFGAFIMLAQISLPLTLITFAVLPFMIFFAFKTRTMMNKAFRETRVKTAETTPASKQPLQASVYQKPIPQRTRKQKNSILPTKI